MITKSGLISTIKLLSGYFRQKKLFESIPKKDGKYTFIQISYPNKFVMMKE